jgi:hypothetical protein
LSLIEITVMQAKKGVESEFDFQIEEYANILLSLSSISNTYLVLKSINGSVVQIIEWNSMTAKEEALKTEKMKEYYSTINRLGQQVSLSSIPEAFNIGAFFKSH